jgi:hypothetical protein
MSAEGLVGTWRLLSFESHTPEDGRRYPFGWCPSGHFVFTAEGWMAATIMAAREEQAGAPRAASSDPTRLRTWLSMRGFRRLVRYVRAATRFMSFIGRYTASGDRVIVQVEVSQLPSLVGTTQELHYVIDGDHLVVTAEMAGGYQRFTCERAGEPAPGLAPEDRQREDGAHAGGAFHG